MGWKDKLGLFFCHAIGVKTAVFFKLFPFLRLEDPCLFGEANGKVKGLDPAVSFVDFGSFRGALLV